MSTAELERPTSQRPALVRNVEALRTSNDLRRTSEDLGYEKVKTLENLLSHLFEKIDIGQFTNKYGVINIRYDLLTEDEFNPVIMDIRKVYGREINIEIHETHESLMIHNGSPRVNVPNEGLTRFDQLPKASSEDMEKYIELLEYINNENVQPRSQTSTW